MKTTTMKAMLILLITIACNQLLLASDKTITKNYTVTDFNALKISSAFQVNFIHSNENKVTVEIDEDVVKNLIVGTTGNELSIKLDKCNFCKTSTLKATVYGNSLSKIYVSGASSFISDHVFKSNEFSVKASGNSNIAVNIAAANLNIDASGASKITVKGSANQQKIYSSGASYYNGKNCKSKDATVSASGASKIIIDCSDSLHAEASGASNIRYISKPKNVEEDTSGASDVGLD